MFSGQMSAHSLNILKWKWHTTSSLKTGLLKDEPPEIELSDYHKAPSPHSESPYGLLDGETSNLEPIEDLDLFIERIYTYYCGKGLWCIIIKWIFELLTLFFIICFSGFFLLYVDWNGLCNAKCGMDAVESGIRPCDLSEEALHKHPLTPLTLSKVIILGYLGIFSVYWIFCFLRFFAQLKEILMIRRFYYDSLHITENQIQTMPWALVLEKVVEVQHSRRLCLIKDLSIHDVVMRLMRKENYLIGMVNKGVLAFPISGWVPGAGPTVRVGPNSVQHRLVLTKTLEWILNWCILQSMFDRNFCLRREFVSDPKTLRKRLMIVGLAMLLLSPFLVIFMLVYLFLRHAEQFYNHPSTASHRRWSNLCKWMFREFNEVDHLFKHRINNSLVHASNYLKQFPSPILTIVAKFISFVSGGFAAVLIIIAFLEESLLEGHIFGRNLFWYAAVFGAITAVSRAAVVDELLVLDPQGAMSLVVEHTHYMPKRWRGKENTETVRLELETLFQYSGMTLLEEMASIFVTPYLLLFVVPKRVDDILQFIVDFTIDVEGVGHVCCFSAFDFENHGNSKYGSPFNSPCSKRSSQGKMEKSALSFQITYPRWEPDAHGKQFLASLKAFRDQKLQARQQTTMNHSALVPLSSMWLIDGEQHKNYPYILDWYYTSQNHNTFSTVEESPIDTYTDEANWRYYTSRNHDTFSTVESPIDTYTGEANWRYFEEPSHLEASTSNPHDSRNGECGTHWWARPPPEGVQVETSFLDPPNFFGNAPYDNSSDRSVEDQECSEWRYRKRHSEKFFMDDLDSREFCLPFDDIYSSRPLESPAENADPVNLV